MRYFRALILSLAFHAIVLLLFWLLAGANQTDLTPKTPTVVELMEPPDLPARPHQMAKDEQQFVRKAEVPPELRSKDRRDARFASEDEQWVLQEQQARQSGLTLNRSPSVGQTKTQANQTRPQNKKSIDKQIDFKPDSSLQKFAEQDLAPSEGDIEMPLQKKPVVNTNRPLDFSRFGSIERGMSTIGEALPDDIKFGDFTALNTDRHLYYSFYSRIEEMVRGRWVNYARAVVYGIENGSEKISGRASFTTQLEIVLDKEGTFSRAILHSSSGSRGLDSAPVQAFRDAQQFPHPPAEMVKEDGTIHIYYAFSVNMVPRYAARSTDDSE
jgi:TonB family protein